MIVQNPSKGPLQRKAVNMLDYSDKGGKPIPGEEGQHWEGAVGIKPCRTTEGSLISGGGASFQRRRFLFNVNGASISS